MNRKVLIAGLLVVAPLVAVLFLNLGRDPHTIRSPLIGKPAPAFALAPVGGGAPVSLQALRGRPVVLNFWATWCMPCLQEQPALNAAALRHARDAQFLGVVYQDEEGRVRQFLGERGATYPSLMDAGSRTAIAYGVAGVPETYFIDRQGTIVDKYAEPLTPEQIDAALHRAGAWQ